MPEGWTMQKFLGKHASKPPNPLVANAFFRAGYLESWGRGIEKIRRECREYGIESPIYDFEMSGLMVTFNANPQHLEAALGEQAAQKSPVKTPVKTPVKILQLLNTNPSMTLTEVAVSIGKSLRAVERASVKLVKEGRLKHVGPQKGGHWTVLK
jgi:ATP-dependent DNA helicase RecG